MSEEQPPGGLWHERHPTFGRSIAALLTKGVLIKLRTGTVFVEEFIACALIGILAVLISFATTNYEDVPDPVVTPPKSNYESAKYFIDNHGELFRAVDDSKGNTKKFITEFFNSEELANLSLADKFRYVKDFKRMKKDLYKTDNFGVGFQWYNAAEDNYSTYPNYTLAEQSSIVSLSVPMISMVTSILYNQFYQEDLTDSDKVAQLLDKTIEELQIPSAYSEISQTLKNLFAASIQEMATNPYKKLEFLSWLNLNPANLSVQQSIQLYCSNYPAESGWNPSCNPYFQIRDSTPKISTAPYPTPGFESELPLGIAVAFFSSMQLIIATMPDTAQILDERDMHLQTLMFLMGCSETAYWLVNFISAFLMGFVAYIVILCCFCFSFGLKGTNFLMCLVLTIIFIITEIWFQFFLLAFMRRSSGGRLMNIILLVLCIFFGYVHEVYTLQESAPDSVRHIFSLFPISCYEMVMMTMYREVRNKRKPCSWEDISSSRFVYRIEWGFIWLIVDFVIYFLLFLLFNAMNPRPFGAPPIGWKEMFVKKSWRRALGLDKTDSHSDNYENIIQVKELTKIYKGFRGTDKLAVNHINFEIKEGEVIVMIGPNGAGKSSILNTLSGALPNNAGTLSLYGGEPQNNFQNIQDILGIVFQDNVLFPKLSVREHLIIFGAFRGIDQKVLEDAIQFFAETLQLTEMLKNRAGDLSGGQKRKLCLSLSLLGNPPIVIMDEPTAGVDVQARQLIWKVISSLKHSTSIVTTHALEEAEAVSSRLFVVSHGNLPFMGTSTEFREQFQCGYVLKINTESDDISDVLKLAQKYDSHAQMLAERLDTILLPVSPQIPKFLRELEDCKENLNIDSYTFSVEQLEDVLLRILETGA
jgi:ABC-type multidrug transport system ATPase subunit